MICLRQVWSLLCQNPSVSPIPGPHGVGHTHWGLPRLEVLLALGGLAVILAWYLHLQVLVDLLTLGDIAQLD